VVAFLILWFWLVVGHFTADYAVQNDFIAKGKNHTRPIPGIPWPWVLAAHAATAGGVVAFFTGSVILGVAEVVLHAACDYNKCSGRFGFTVDQCFHLACGLLWAVTATWFHPGF
jgi:hypothetical protein